MNTGERYGEYDIIREIGRGSMGVVYLATRRETGQQVALKVVPYRDSDEARENIEAEKRGAELQQAIARDDHRVVVVNRVLFTHRDLNVEMEFVDGNDLSELIKAGPLPADRAARIAAELCEMLCRLGAKTPPVVHGDLKPRNVRLRPGGQIKVLDFGIAKEMLRGEGTVNVFQTVNYASPERIETSVASKESDLWSVGIILAEMASGRHPFQAGGREEMRRRILSGSRPDALPQVPTPVQRIVFQALAFRPEHRYPGPQAMLADLRRFLAGDPVLAPEPFTADDDGTQRTTSDDNATRRTVPDHRPVIVPAKPPAPRFPNLRRVLGGALTVVLAIGIVGAIEVWRQMTAWADSGKLIDQISRNEIDQTAAWTRYQAVREETPVKFLLVGLGGAVKRKLLEAGEEPIKDLRSDVPTAVEGDWQRALTDLQRAHDIDPGDKTVLGNLRICEGHLQRIRAKSKGRKPNRKGMNLAIADFEEAEKLMPKSPDPYISLARLYFYDQPDPEKGDQMIEEASKRGHAPSKREMLERADGMRLRAIRAEQQAQRFLDLHEQQKKLLETARDDYQAAFEGFQEVNDFPGRDLAADVRDTLSKKKNVETRLSAIGGSQSTSFSLSWPFGRKVSE